MSITNSDDFILYKVGDQIHGGAFPINNILSNNNYPAIIGGGKNKFGIPIGLALINNIPHKENIIGSFETKDYMNGGFASDNLYDTLLNKFMNGGDKNVIKIKKTKKNNKRLQKNTTRKKHKK
jgi:hypothetical protein